MCVSDKRKLREMKAIEQSENKLLRIAVTLGGCDVFVCVSVCVCVNLCVCDMMNIYVSQFQAGFRIICILSIKPQSY